MCLAVPSKIIEIHQNKGIVELDGVCREVSLRLVEETGIGDYVIIHAGFAISRIDEEAALETLRLLRDAAERI